MSSVNIAPCGLVCSHCDAYCATQNHNPDQLEQVAAHWRKLNHCDAITADKIPCNGCLNEHGPKSFFCQALCQIRPCAIAKKVEICAKCAEYPCQKLKDFWACVPADEAVELKKLLEQIAAVEQKMASIL